MDGDNEAGVGLELTALREQRAKARKEREQQSKRRRLLLNKTLEPDIIDTIPELKSVILQPENPTKHLDKSDNSALQGTPTTKVKEQEESPSRGSEKYGGNKDEELNKKKRENSSQNTRKGGRLKEERPNQLVTSTSVHKNDYSQHFVDTKQRPQNFIRDSDLADRFEEYPKLRELIQLKDKLVHDHSTPIMYMNVDLKTCDLAATLGTKFDVILIDPPWEEYNRRDPTLSLTSNNAFWTLEEMMQLKVDQIAESPCFLWLWVGSAEGLDQGRLLLKKWGFRRCEDICWLKTNKNGQQNTHKDPGGFFHHTKEHCLMGIKGTVRRNQDSHVIHANIDTDIIISEEPPLGSTEKPVELYHIIEHFSLGRRRLELFGHDHNIRPGWVTLGSAISNSNYSASTYKSYFTGELGPLLPSTPEIENLRPKSPPRGGQRHPPSSHSTHRPHRPSSHPHPHPHSQYPAAPSTDAQHSHNHSPSPSPSYAQPYPRPPRQASNQPPYKPKDGHHHSSPHDSHHSGHGYHFNGHHSNNQHDHHQHASRPPHSHSPHSHSHSHHPPSRHSPGNRPAPGHSNYRPHHYDSFPSY